MPRYKDSPEVRAAKKERKRLRELLSLLDVEDMSDLMSVFKKMVGEVLENGLEAELGDELPDDIICPLCKHGAESGDFVDFLKC